MGKKRNPDTERKIKARDDNGKPICGAKTRSGGKCRQKPMPNGRCRMHGGNNPGSAKKGQPSPALKHGIYSKFLTEEEKSLKASMELGRVDDELSLCRIRLRRILQFEQDMAEGDGMQLEETEDTVRLGSEEEEDDEEFGRSTHKKKHKRYDFEDAVDRLLRRIESLEKTRQLLIGEGGTEADKVLDDLLDELDD